MEYRNSYISPLGRILLTADEIGLTGLAFEGQKNAVQGLIRESEEKETTLFSGVKKWLDIYFSGVEPDFQIPIHLEGTDFQMCVWEMLCTIPYGETTTYGAIAKQIAHDRRDFKDVESGGWKCYRTQPCVGDRSVSQSDRSKRKSDRICRRN